MSTDGSDGSEAVANSVSIPGSDAVRYSVETDSALRYSVSEPGIVSNDSNDVMDALDDWDGTIAVAYSVLPCDAVTNFSEATSDRVSEP